MSGTSNLANLNHVNVPLLVDERGLIGRECPEPSCLRFFQVKPGTGLKGPGLLCHCPYCGHADQPDRFTTPEQNKYAISVATRAASDALLKDLRDMATGFNSRSPRFMRMTVTDGEQPALRDYQEPLLETIVTCEQCTLVYAVYGAFGYCSDCKAHNSNDILRYNLDLVEKLLTLASTQEDGDLRRQLVESALANCVSAFDGFGRETIRVRAVFSSDPARATDLSFQNLSRANDQLEKFFAVKLKAVVLPEEWAAAERAFFKRHVISHRSGVVDEHYMNQSGDAEATVGRRVPLESDEVRRVTGILRKLGTGMLGILPKP